MGAFLKRSNILDSPFSKTWGRFNALFWAAYLSCTCFHFVHLLVFHLVVSTVSCLTLVRKLLNLGDTKMKK